MTTVANKDASIGADKRRTSYLSCGTPSYDDTVTKVFKFGSLEWGQAGMVGLTELLGLHLRGLDVRQKIIDLCKQCHDMGIAKEQVVGQVLVYNGDKRFFLQAASELLDNGIIIEFADIEIPVFSIGSGSEFAFPVLISGGSVEEAINHAMQHDEGTGGGIDMAHEQVDTSTNVVSLTAPKSADEALKKDGFMDDKGQYTAKSVGYTSTKILNLQELAKMGLVKNLSHQA